MRIGPAERIEAGIMHIGHDARKLVGIQVDAGELIPAEVGLDRHGRETRGGIDVADDGPAAVHGVGQQAAQQVQGLVQILGLIAHDQDAETGAIARDDHAVAIQHPAARRRHEAEVELVVGSKRGVFLGLNDLKLAQPSDQGDAAQRGQAAEYQGAAQEGTLALVWIGKDQGRFRAHRNLTSPSSNRSIMLLANGKRRRVGIRLPATANKLGRVPVIRVMISQHSP